MNMNAERFREFCLSKAMAEEDFPFDEEVLAFRVNGKIFALTAVSEHPGSCNLKCDPEKAVQLRERYPAITPGFHMNKKHWNTVEWDGSISDLFIFELVDHSYELVANRHTVNKKPAMKKAARNGRNKKP
jgi:predicted DNA-binding protein (MmcQ/YjbR family)